MFKKQEFNYSDGSGAGVVEGGGGGAGDAGGAGLLLTVGCRSN